MRKSVILSLLALLCSAIMASAAQDAPKNLQVLDKNMSKDQLKQTMKQMSQALGVSCDYCHDTNDLSKETANKKKAREMLQMIGQVNENYMKKYGTKLTCYTCHHGNKTPKTR